MGFEPTISTVTGWRALRAALRGPNVPSGSGGSRTHSIPGSKPGWSTSCLPSRLLRQYPEQESNLQTLGFKPSRSAGWRIWACLQWSRMESNHRFLDVTQASSPLDHGTVFSVDSPGVAPGFPACGAGVFLLDHEPILSERKPWDSNPQVAVRPPVFKTGSSSGRMTSVL